jgi:spermidine synthase
MNINLFIYLFSGFFSLALQIIWQRKLFIIFGGTMYSVAIILCAWMLGLGIGSYLGGKITGKHKNPTRLFAYTQIAIAAYAMISTWLFNGVNAIDGTIFALQQNNLAISLLVRAAIIILILLIPTILFGAGLPVLTGALGKRQIPRLYYLNTLGSVIGAVMITFFFLPVLGTAKSIFTLSILILLINLAVILTAKNGPAEEVKEEPIRLKGKQEKFVLSPAGKKVLLILIPVLFFLSGFTSLSYELLYNRIILYLFSTTTFYTFSIILITFILGLTLGAFCYHLFQKRLHALSAKLLCFALLEVVIGFWHVLLPHYCVWVNENQFLVNVMNLFPGDFIGTVFRRSVFSGLLILPPIFIFGFIYPMVIDIYLYLKNENIQENVGKIGLFNLGGSTIGPIITGFFLIGVFQVAGSLRIVSILNLFIGLTIFSFLFTTTDFAKVKKFAGTCAVISGILILTSFLISNSFVTFYKIARMAEDNQLLLYKEGVFATVSVTQKTNHELSLNVNAMPEVPTDHDSIRTFRLLAYLPFVVKGDARSALCIAFGGGITFGSVCQVPALQEIKCAEICRDVLDAAGYFKDFNHNVRETHSQNIAIEDGRRFVEKTPQKFDLIICDSTHPAESDSWVLFTREFYAACNSKLNPNGIMAQWIPIHGLPLYDYKIILRTFAREFKEVSLFYCNHYSIVVGSSTPIRLSPENLAGLLQNSTIKSDLETANLSSLKEIEQTRVFESHDLKAFAGEGEIATEDFTPIQFSEIRRIGKRDARLDILDGFCDYLQQDQKRDPDLKFYQNITFKLHEYIYNNDYVNLLFYLDENKAELQKRGLDDNEFGIIFDNAKQIVVDYFFKQKHILEVKDNPTPENIKLIERLSFVISDNFDFQFIKGVLYFKTQNLTAALDVFLKLNQQKQIPQLSKFIIITLEQLGRKDEANRFQTEARQKFGPGFGEN